MLEPQRIKDIVGEVARANLRPTPIDDILTEPAIDSVGQDALRITIVIPPGAARQLEGDAVLDNLVQIQDRLREAGEERFPIVEYATKEELESDGDSQT